MFISVIDPSHSYGVNGVGIKHPISLVSAAWSTRYMCVSSILTPHDKVMIHHPSCLNNERSLTVLFITRSIRRSWSHCWVLFKEDLHVFKMNFYRCTTGKQESQIIHRLLHLVDHRLFIFLFFLFTVCHTSTVSICLKKCWSNA